MTSYRVPNARPGKDTVEREIYGMDGLTAEEISTYWIPIADFHVKMVLRALFIIVEARTTTWKCRANVASPLLSPLLSFNAQRNSKSVPIQH